MTTTIIENTIVVGVDTGVGRYIQRELSQHAPTAPGAIICLPDDCRAEDILSMAAEVEEVSPQWIVLVSSWEVYPVGIDELIYENSRVSPDTEYGRRCREAEQTFGTLAGRLKAPLAILRPAMLFGSNIGGEGNRIFRQVLTGRFFTIRDQKAERSLLCAIDLAKAVMAMAGRDGVFNIADGRRHALVDIANAMSDNTGMSKRTPVLPLKAARWAARMASLFPGLPDNWRTAALEEKCHARCLDTSRLAEILPEMKYYDTVAVIARREKDYPYQDE